MRTKAIAICAFAVMAFCAAASAQTGKLGVGVHGTWVKSVTEEDARDWAWGLHARARLTGHFAIEGSLDFRNEEIDDATTVKLYPIQVSALFYLLPNSKAGIYGLFGVGWTRVSASGDFFGDDVENTEFGYHYGFGIEVPAGSSAIFIDVRYLDLNLDISNVLIPDFDSSGWQLNVGYSFYF